MQDRKKIYAILHLFCWTRSHVNPFTSPKMSDIIKGNEQIALDIQHELEKGLRRVLLTEVKEKEKLGEILKWSGTPSSHMKSHVSLSHIKTRHGYDFLLYFPLEILMNFRNLYTKHVDISRHLTPVTQHNDRSLKHVLWCVHLVVNIL